MQKDSMSYNDHKMKAIESGQYEEADFLPVKICFNDLRGTIKGKGYRGLRYGRQNNFNK